VRRHNLFLYNVDLGDRKGYVECTYRRGGKNSVSAQHGSYVSTPSIVGYFCKFGRFQEELINE